MNDRLRLPGPSGIRLISKRLACCNLHPAVAYTLPSLAEGYAEMMKGILWYKLLPIAG